MNTALLIYNARLLDESIDTPGALLVIDDKIRAVYTGYFTNKKTVESLALSVLTEDGYGNCSVEYHDAQGLTITPAFVDMHCHLRYPGQTQKEDLQSGLSAAAAGGFGTVAAMPNTSPVISSREMALQVEADASSLRLANLMQAVSITRNFEGKDVSHIDGLTSDRIPFISEDGRDVVSAEVMLAGMKKATDNGMTVSCHCEDQSLAIAARAYREKALALMRQFHLDAWGGSDDDAEDLGDSVITEIESSLRCANDTLALAENIATLRNIELARATGCHIHIAHVSTAIALDAVRNAKLDIHDDNHYFIDDDTDAVADAYEEHRLHIAQQSSVDSFSVTCEVTPHHLALSCAGSGPLLRALVNPPVRSEDDRLVLLEGLRDGTVDVIATDHAPHTADDKAAGAPGFTGFETAYGVCNTVLVAGNQLPAKRLSQLMSANPARILHLNKGLLAAGYDADFTVVDPEEKWTVDSTKFLSKGKATPFNGMNLTGRVKETFVAGRRIFPK